mgnify:CR=1 FL=1
MERAWMKHRKKRLAALLLAICMVAGMLLGVAPGVVRAAELPSVYYSGHMQTYGNLAQVKDGTTLGNLGTGKRLEAIKIDVPNTRPCSFRTESLQFISLS